jgi:hypothetical protein
MDTTNLETLAATDGMGVVRLLRHMAADRLRITGLEREVADTVGACPLHGSLLQCECQYTWRGTDAEFRELMPLAERLGPYFDQIPPSGRRCQCGGQLWCRVCYEAAARQIVAPPDPFAAEERARYVELLAHLECTPR